MKYMFMIFILLASLVIIGGHTGLYFSWLKFFMITGDEAKKWLAVILGILSLSFIVMSLVSYYKETALINWLYSMSGAWLGIVWYLLLATVAAWLVYWIGNMFGAKLPLGIIAGIFLGISVVYSAYGIWNAQNPIIKRITVTIPNLPSEWRGRTALQLSDVHLGPEHREAFMQKVVDQVKNVNPSAVFITGDLFDGGGTDLKTLASPLNQLIPPLGMYYITGNHETYVGLNKSLAALQGVRVKILRDQMVVVDGMQIVGIDYPLMGEKKDFPAIMSPVDKQKPAIVLWHEPNHLDQLRQLGATLVLSGHTHDGQVWPFNYVTDMVYPGHGYGLSSKDGFSVYTSSGVGTWGPPMRTGNRPEIVLITFN
jgi:uncharacterized protein